MRKIDLIYNKDADNYILKRHYYSESISSYYGLYINGVEYTERINYSNITIPKSAKIQYKTKANEILHYIKGDVIMEVEEYNNKFTYYDSDSSDEHTLRAIANRKELQGFEPVYREVTFIDYEINIVGCICDTGSKFISTSITGKYDREPLIYILNVNRVALSEYTKLAKQHKGKARFSEFRSSDNNLRYVQIDGKYVFPDRYPFNASSSDLIYTNLDDAINKEKEIREAVKTHIEAYIFRDNLTTEQKTSLINYLQMVQKANSIEIQNKMLELLINDLSEYKNNIKI